MNFTTINTDNTFSLCMAMLNAELTAENAFSMLKSVLNTVDYTIDGIELELYQFKMQCRDGLNKDAELWANELIDLWVNS